MKHYSNQKNFDTCHINNLSLESGKLFSNEGTPQNTTANRIFNNKLTYRRTGHGEWVDGVWSKHYSKLIFRNNSEMNHLQAFANRKLR